MTNPDFGGSAWFDIGVYCLNLVDFLFDSEPEEVRSVSYLLSPNVDKDMAVSLKYPGERLASLSVSMTCDRLKTATICGTKGIIIATDPFCLPPPRQKPTGYKTKNSSPQVHVRY